MLVLLVLLLLMHLLLLGMPLQKVHLQATLRSGFRKHPGV